MSARLDGIVLAAGRSLRMGRPKPLLRVGDETFLGRAVRLLRDAGCAGVSVVIAAGDDGAAAAAVASGASVVINPYPGSEQIDSLRLAIGALPRESAAAAILPVDLPRLATETVSTVIVAWRGSIDADPALPEREPLADPREHAHLTPLAVVPSYRGEPGHPVVLSRALFAALAAPGLLRGLETVLERHADGVLSVEVDDPGCVHDIDTPAEYDDLVYEVERPDAARSEAREPGELRAGEEGDGAPDGARETDDRPHVARWLALTGEPASSLRPPARDPRSPLTALHAAAVAVATEAGGPAVAIVTALPPSRFAGRRMIVYDDGRSTGSLADDELDAAALELGRDALRGDAPLTREIAPHGDAHPADEPIVLYAEAHRPPDELIVVGAGHIAVPLARLGIDLGFRVTVLDDREEFATEDRFADGVHVVRADFEHDPFAATRIGPRSYITLVTRGHKWDVDCLRRLLEMPVQPHYIGMIGSRRRVRAAFSALLDAGTPRDQLARVHAPIGIEVGAETPAEIAVSIAAELVQVRRGADPASLTLKERVLDRLLPDKEEIHG